MNYSFPLRLKYKMKVLIKKILEFFTSVPVLGDRITNLSYEKCIKRKSEDIRLARTAGFDSFFCFFSDTHWGANSRKSPNLVREIGDRALVQRVFFGGDYITHVDSSKNAMLDLGKMFYEAFSREGFGFYPILGNHDTNSYEQTDINGVISENELSSVLRTDCATGDSLYREDDWLYYVDNPKMKELYLCLNTASADGILKAIPALCRALAESDRGGVQHSCMRAYLGRVGPREAYVL